LEYYFKTLAIFEEVFGKDSPYTISIYKKIAYCYKNIGDLENLEKYRKLAFGR
jgi:hypothetical protein